MVLGKNGGLLGELRTIQTQIVQQLDPAFVAKMMNNLTGAD